MDEFEDDYCIDEGSWVFDWYMDEDERMAEYDNEVLDSYNAEEDYWVGARYAGSEGG